MIGILTVAALSLTKTHYAHPDRTAFWLVDFGEKPSIWPYRQRSVPRFGYTYPTKIEMSLYDISYSVNVGHTQQPYSSFYRRLVSALFRALIRPDPKKNIQKRITMVKKKVN